MPAASGYESRSGVNHYRWKGDEASYSAVHQWMRRHWPMIGKCEFCDVNAPTEWANLSGRYDRHDRSDWRELCKSCHRKLDTTDFDPEIAKRNRAKTHCAHGHPFDDANTYVHHRTRNGNSIVERECRTCHREREERRRSSLAHK